MQSPLVGDFEALFVVAMTFSESDSHFPICSQVCAPLLELQGADPATPVPRLLCQLGAASEHRKTEGGRSGECLR